MFARAPATWWSRRRKRPRSAPSGRQQDDAAPISGGPLWPGLSKRTPAPSVFRTKDHAAIGAAVADISLNNGRILFGMMGQDELTAACQPMLARAVAEKGVDFDTLVLGDVLRMNVSTDEGLVMERQISAAHEGSRYAGSFTCRRLEGKLSLTWRMSPVDPSATASTRT